MKMSYDIRSLADIKAIEKTPLADRIPEKNTYELLDKAAAINPDGIAISFIKEGHLYQEPIEITYRDFIKRIRQTANMLHDLGVGPEDVVTYLLPNLPQTHFVLWGAEAVGIVNPVNPLLEASAIRDICNAAGTKIIVTLAAQPDSDIWAKVEAVRGDIPSLTHVIRVMGPSDEEKGILGYEEVIDRYDGGRLSFERDFKADDIASLYHTGGTTGLPKLARRTHYNEISVSHCVNLGLNLLPGDGALVGLPMFHANATIITGLVPLSKGGHIVLLSPSGFRDPAIMQNFYKIVDRFRPVFFSCVPTILSVLMTVPIGNSDISSLDFIVCGAAPLSVELFHKFEAYSGMKIIEGYGLTESTVACAMNPLHGIRKIGSIGLRIAYQQMKIAIIDDDGNYIRDGKTDEIGVVCIKGSSIFKGYVEDRHNEGIWLPDGWFNSGDLGRQDKDGYFWLAGRKKELIIRGGHNIDPATIEEALYKMDGIMMVAAIGRPDAHAGEVPIAYVELAKESRLTSEDIMGWAREKIGERAAIPKDVIIIDKIPLTAVGKMFKPALKRDAIKKKYAKELRALGDMATIDHITVEEDNRHGTKVSIILCAGKNIKAADIKKRVTDILAPYTLHYSLVMTNKRKENV